MGHPKVGRRWRRNILASREEAARDMYSATAVERVTMLLLHEAGPPYIMVIHPVRERPRSIMPSAKESCQMTRLVEMVPET
jgi:hypothetical protein